MFELFLQDQTGFLGQSDIDPCIQSAARLAAGAISQRIFDNCAAAGIAPDYAGGIAQATIISGGDSEEHTSELQSLMRISYAVFCLQKKKKQPRQRSTRHQRIRDYI